jgi:hypothetical protein
MTEINVVNNDELEREQFDYQSYISTYVEGFVSKLFSNGIINEVEAEKLKEYFSNPDQYQKELEQISEYYYISNGEIFQLFDAARVLPTLNYKIDAFDKSKSFEKYSSLINKVLYKIRHKTLTRDILSQTVHTGTLCGIWLGDKNNPYFYIFDDLDYVFPSHRVNGQWVVAVDMAWFEGMTEYQRKVQLKNLSPYITQRDYNNYLKDREKYKYKYLPQERTAVIRTHTLKRNQNRGIGWATQGLYDILHKKKLRDLEKAVANKIINAVAILKIGSDKNNGEYSNLKLPKAVKKKVHSGVKAALEKNSKDGITVVAIPDFADLEFPDINSGDSLDPKKFESINNDIMAGLTLSPALLNGTGGNYASAKINIDFFYKKIAVLLEEIETEVYGKLFNIILPTNQKDNFFMVYDKEPPLTNKEKIDILMKLHTQEGFSLKAVIDSLNGVEFSEYIEQSIYEQNILKLPQKIQPYASAYTGGKNNDDAGRPSIENPTNENTQRSKENDGNSQPD